MILRVLLLSFTIGCLIGSGTDTKPVSCDDPQGYSLEQSSESGTNNVNIVRGGTVLHTIKLPTDATRNGFALDELKKTKAGFEILVEYGSRIFYSKRFIFECKRHRFYLTRIKVESFDKQNPQKYQQKVIVVQPNVPVEKFVIEDFMLEGVVKH